MKRAAIPPDEDERLAALKTLDLLDTRPEERFDRITRMAVQALHVPIATLTLIDRDREWFKSTFGLKKREGPRAISFCGHAILKDGPFIVTDARKDRRFHDNPLVVKGDRIRAYAAFPLHAITGERVGAFCVKDVRPRTFRRDELTVLEALAAWAERELQAHECEKAVLAQHKSNENLRRAARTLRALDLFHRALPEAAVESDLLGRACRILVDEFGYALAWIGEAEHDRGRTVRPVAERGFARGYLRKAGIVWSDSPRGRGPTGTAIRTGRTVVARWIKKEPAFRPWRKAATERGYASSIAIPLRIDGTMFGALNVYASAADAFSKDERRMLESCAREIATGLAKLRSERERDAAERQLQKTHRFFSAVIDNVYSIVAIFDRRGRIRRVVTPATERMLGYPAAELIGMSIFDLAHPDDIVKIRGAMSEGIRNPKHALAVEVRFKRRTGDWVDLLATGQDLTGEEAIGGILVVAEDVTKLRQAEVKTRALDLLKSRFITALTHVVRTPLNEMRWGLETMLEGELGAIEPSQENVIRKLLESDETIIRELDNMNLLLDIERGTLRLDMAPTKLSSVAAAVFNRNMRYCGAKGVSCSRRWPERGEPAILMDGEKITRVIQTFVSNAISYTERGGISLSVEVRRGGVRLRVKDSGIGIPAPEQAFVFERFFRASNAATADPSGIGIGLPIAKAIVEAHGGTMGFKSAEGRGSEFWFELPTAARA